MPPREGTVPAVSKRDSSNRTLRFRCFSLHAETSPRGEENESRIGSPILSPCADAIASPGKRKFWPRSSMWGTTMTGVLVTTLHPARVCPSSARTRLAPFDPFR